MNQSYPSNLTSEQWELLSGLIPPAKKGGRKRSVDMEAVINAILYILCAGCAWRMLPHDFPNWKTVYHYFRQWRKDGTWQQIHERLRLWVRVSQNREASPSEVIMDSQSVETATMVSKEVGYDSGKKIKGRKRHIVIDTLGLLIVVVITAANVSEQAGAKQVLWKLDQVRDRMGRLIRIWVDGGYRGKDFTQWVIHVYRWLWSVVTRQEEQKGFVVLPKRWMVERTFGWFNWCRRLSKDYEILPQTSEAFIYVAMIRLMLKQLA
ncbi:transposase (plasmid) [Scytonema sp. HK-05]|uniref:IS5 family transposase n=1 Tax=Scytonema sp. HK-05 TaxID=1137095 RepID=UPI000935DA0B|nr:IS5 family transposase [Scytonema sp. HK-05]OKH43602.1 IS5 family transposase [Scytonema sp. HK-05]BAY50481.1 transposase [Scytonema sp. HK-05]